MPRGGKREGAGAKPSNSVETFLSRVKIGDQHECWPYEWGAKDHGYGLFWYQRKPYKAHRFAYWYFVERIDLNAPKDVYEKGFVLHRCGNRACCNPAHLYLGDLPQNMRDKVRHGTQSRLRGERHPFAKITMEIATTIRESYAAGATKMALAEKYGVSVRFIGDVLTMRTYRPLTLP